MCTTMLYLDSMWPKDTAMVCTCEFLIVNLNHTPDSNLVKAGVRDRMAKNYREGERIHSEIIPRECGECVHCARVMWEGQRSMVPRIYVSCTVHVNGGVNIF